MPAPVTEGRTSALITGASRGIGAAVARILAADGVRVGVNYREKARRADRVVEEVRQAGGRAFAVQADLTDPRAVAAMAQTVATECGALETLVLNASGGLERDADPSYALRLNRDAQLNTVDAMLPLLPDGGRIVFVTSHQAHFHGAKAGLDHYEPVARSKRAGEDALRARIPEFAERGVDLVVVSGDMIEGTITATLLDRASPGTVELRRDAAGGLVTVEEFASEVAAATTMNAASGHTVYVGGRDYLAAADHA